jgi:hypothetical protein
MVPLTTQSMRCCGVIGCRASLLLEEPALKGDEDVSVSESGATAEASVPGIRFCCARTTQADKKIEQLNLQIIPLPPDAEDVADCMPS